MKKKSIFRRLSAMMLTLAMAVALVPSGLSSVYAAEAEAEVIEDNDNVNQIKVTFYSYLAYYGDDEECFSVTVYADEDGKVTFPEPPTPIGELADKDVEFYQWYMTSTSSVTNTRRVDADTVFTADAVVTSFWKHTDVKDNITIITNNDTKYIDKYYIDKELTKEITKEEYEEKLSLPKYYVEKQDEDYTYGEYSFLEEKSVLTDSKTTFTGATFINDISYQPMSINRGAVTGIGSMNIGASVYYFETQEYHDSNEYYIRDGIKNHWLEEYVAPPSLKGVCQIPNSEGTGALIGLETMGEDAYSVEILILDCNLLKEGKDAWIYTTGKCGIVNNCLWTTQDLPYGYFWTLFRVYDQYGRQIDEKCYGFENVF